ncbi:hypothetical protein KUTeg_013126 [Tegillarca granosa]|uniref:Uncharacterized protein n=1 Tax=Tegillarca granosa TaxID=220873 RepID=A0ABQ9EW96_TEGGR|nr:hypothetical protein KUTeg_013126 [Tegillarca granosa]
MARINCYPENPLVDQIVSIKIQGLSAGRIYTIRSSLYENKVNFSACGCYISNDNGNIDVQESFCTGGTYTGIESMGLFWSMKQEPGKRRNIRLLKGDILEPLKVTLSVYEGGHTWKTFYKNKIQPVASTNINRWYKSKDVQRINVKSRRLRGRLFIPTGKDWFPGEGPFPGVIDLFGAFGLTEIRAALLASRGFITYPLPFHNFEDLPAGTGSDLDYFLEAVDYLSSHNLISAAVLINGPPFLTIFDMKFGDTIYECVNKNVGFDFSKLRNTHEGLALRDAYHNYSTKDIIQVWKTDANILYIVGDDDETLDPKLAEALLNQYPEDKRSLIEITTYPGAGHLIDPPYMPLCRSSYTPLLGRTILIKHGRSFVYAIMSKQLYSIVR